jgi:LysM repeat protein
MVEATSTGPRSRLSRFASFVALVTVLVAAVLILTIGPSINLKAASRHAASFRAAARRPPPWWVVQPGDTLGGIAAKTGLNVDQLEALNPNVDPQTLDPGQRLQLWQHPPPPPPKPLGPMFFTVGAGDSFGSIADKTGINLDTLEQLNPQLKPSALQPGERVRLRK